jgi:hypothetical protein
MENDSSMTDFSMTVQHMAKTFSIDISKSPQEKSFCPSQGDYFPTCAYPTCAYLAGEIVNVDSHTWTQKIDYIRSVPSVLYKEVNSILFIDGTFPVNPEEPFRALGTWQQSQQIY